MIARIKQHWRMLLLITTGIVVLAFAAKTIVSASSKPVEPIVYHDMNYVETGTNPFQTLDVYIPANAEGKLPLVVWIHGGAWVSGDKNHPWLALQLIERGFAVASINYRLAQNCPHPAQINDCKAAIRWLRKNAGRYNIDSNRIGCWGHSAGGHLAAFLGTTGDIDILGTGKSNIVAHPSISSADPTASGIPVAVLRDSAVQAVCDWAGPTDLSSLSSQQTADSKLDFNDPAGPVAILLGGVTPEKCFNASPVSYISADDPPLFIAHGDEDDVVPPAQSKEMYEKVKAAGLPVELALEHGEGHALSSADALRRSLEFFDKFLKNTALTKLP